MAIYKEIKQVHGIFWFGATNEPDSNRLEFEYYFGKGYAFLPDQCKFN